VQTISDFWFIFKIAGEYSGSAYRKLLQDRSRLVPHIFITRLDILQDHKSL